MDEGSKIIFTEKTSKFFFNRSWSRKNPFNSHLTMGKHSRIIINGHFRFYNNTAIGLHPRAKLILGNGYINSGAIITIREGLSIGNNVIIGPRVTIRDTDDHVLDGSPIMSLPIKIEDDIWIGANVTILKGVTIGKGSVIAANSLVNKSIPERTLAGGVPCKILRENVNWS